jgi:glycosyltransferase involved in cell wall biosynthesis
LKIFITIPLNPFFESSASANRWLTLIEELMKYKGLQIELLITEGYANEKEKQELGTQGNYLGITYQYLNKMSNTTLWQRRRNKYLWMPLHKKIIMRKALRYLKDKTEGIVWTSPSLEGFELAVTLKKKKSKLKTFVEMSEFLDIHQFNDVNPLQLAQGEKQQKYFETKALYAYDGMALMTKTLMTHYKNFQGLLPELFHLPMTVDLGRFEDAIISEVSKSLQKPYVVYIGVMNNKKDGVDILIEAFAQVKHLIPNLKLYLFGPYHYDTPGHLNQIANLQLSDSVFYKGEVHRDNVPSILAEAELLVLPRPDSKQAQGGFPTKLGEYLATGKPVCATKVGEIPNYLIDNQSVFFATPGSVDSFAKAMITALSNKDNAIRIGKNGKSVAEKEFNKDIQAKKLHQFLLKL